MSRRRKALAALVGTLGLAVVLAVLTLFVLTRTDWGRERVRAFGVGQLAKQVAGRVTVQRLSGSLLTGATLAGVEITDSSGAPFLRADTVAIRYSLRSFLSKHLVFTGVRIVNPVIVLDQPPGGEWNFVRLLPQDTTAAPDTLPGFGSWVRIEDLTIRNGSVVVRRAWAPADSLSDPARERVVEEALSPRSRPLIVAVPGGYQLVSAVYEMNAELPLLRLADPDSAAHVVDVASLSAIAYPFRPPAAAIRQLSGRFVIGRDSAWFDDLRLVLPGTRAAAVGVYAFDSGDVRVAVRVDTATFGDLRWVRPDLPDGRATFAAQIARAEGELHVQAERIELQTGGATLAGHANVWLGESVRVGSTELAFANIDTRLIERLASGTILPVSGVAAGRIALRGDPSALQVEGSAEFRERNGGTSRIVAAGEIATGDAFAARSLRLRLDPLQLGLVRAFAPDLPVHGRIGGTALVNGSTAARITTALDLTLDATTGRSHVIGNVVVASAGGPHFDADLRAPRVALETLGAFAPQAALHGVARATIRARGTPNAITFAADLTLADGGSLAASGSLSAGGATAGYDVRAAFDRLDASVASTRAPQTRLSGTVTVRGAGTEPAAM